MVLTYFLGESCRDRVKFTDRIKLTDQLRACRHNTRVVIFAVSDGNAIINLTRRGIIAIRKVCSDTTTWNLSSYNHLRQIKYGFDILSPFYRPL